MQNKTAFYLCDNSIPEWRSAYSSQISKEGICKRLSSSTRTISMHCTMGLWVKYLGISFTFEIYLGTSWIEATTAQGSVQWYIFSAGWWRMCNKYLGWVECKKDFLTDLHSTFLQNKSQTCDKIYEPKCSIKMNNFASFRRKIIIIFHSMLMFNVQPIFCIVDTGSCFYLYFLWQQFVSMADQRYQQCRSRNSKNKKETAVRSSGRTNDWSVSQHEAYLFLMTLLPPLTHQGASKLAQVNLFIVSVSFDNLLTAWSNWDVGFPWKIPKTDETSLQCPVQCNTLIDIQHQVYTQCNPESGPFHLFREWGPCKQADRHKCPWVQVLDNTRGLNLVPFTKWASTKL